MAQSKHVVHTRNSLRAIDEHVSQNKAFAHISYEVLVMEMGYEYHRRNGLRHAVQLCPHCTLILSNTSMFAFIYLLLWLAYVRFCIDYKARAQQPYLSMVNIGGRMARGNRVLFLTDNTEISANTVTTLLLQLDNSSIGVVGGRLLAPDQTIVHGGMEFILTKKSKWG